MAYCCIDYIYWIFCEKNEKQKIKISGTVYDKEKNYPLHNARISVSTSSAQYFTTLSYTNGYYELMIPIENDDKIVIEVIKKGYKDFKTTALNPQSSEYYNLYLESHNGAIHALFDTDGSCENLRVYYVEGNDDNLIEVTDLLDECSVLIENIDAHSGAVQIVASNEEYYGISDMIDLAKEVNYYTEVVIPVESIDKKSDLIFQVLDANSGNPIPISKTTIHGYTDGSFGIPSYYLKTLLTDENGNVVFKDMPKFIGTIDVSHGLYKPVSLTVWHDGYKSELNSFVLLEKIN